MLAVLLTVHLFACIALVIAVMLQRSEGGALGMGGGGTGGLISGRGAASVLVRTTMVLAGIFFITSITMTRLNASNQAAPGTLERTLQQPTSNPLDPLAPKGSGTTPGTAPAPSSTPAPAPVDPLAPVVNTPPAGQATPSTPPATTPPATQPAAPGAATPPAATAPAQPATPAPAPAQPAPRPETGGSNPG